MEMTYECPHNERLASAFSKSESGVTEMWVTPPTTPGYRAWVMVWGKWGCYPEPVTLLDMLGKGRGLLEILKAHEVNPETNAEIVIVATLPNSCPCRGRMYHIARYKNA